MRIHDKNYRDAHGFVQGDHIIAVNESCAVIGHGPDRRVSVSFFSYRWNVLDEDRAKMNAELLRERLEDFERSVITADTMSAMAAECLTHYKIGEREGWLEEIPAIWEHDCEDCIFLGPMTADGGIPSVKKDQTTNESPLEPRVDLYYCPEARPFPTVIARYGPDGPDYKSGMLFGMFDLDPDLKEAYRRATSYGLVNGVKLPRLNAIDQGTGSIGRVISEDELDELGTSFLVKETN